MNSKRTTLIVLAVAVALSALWFLTRGSSVSNEVDLLAKVGEAERRSNVDDPKQFGAESVTIDGTTKKAILVRPHSRLTYTVAVPPDAWLDVAFALKPETWDLPGDGAQFRVGVSDGRNYEELLRQYVNPKRGDRKWFSVRLDLSAYEDRQVRLVFNTDPGPPGDGDVTNDLAVWAEPRVYSKR
jgi:hypothetical protein